MRQGKTFDFITEIKRRVRKMILIKEKTDNTALLYISKDEAQELNIQWINDSRGYAIENKQEEIKKLSKISEKLNFKKFGYDITKTTEEEKEALRKEGIKEDMPFSIFVKKENKVDPIITYINMLNKEKRNVSKVSS